MADTPAASRDLGEAADGETGNAGPAVAAEATGSPLSVLLQRLGLSQAEALIRRRPELGLAIAFAGGLVAATMLKRLGRR
jgi:hypothetical protein